MCDIRFVSFVHKSTNISLHIVRSITFWSYIFKRHFEATLSSDFILISFSFSLTLTAEPQY